MGTIKAKQWATMSEPHPACSKADERSLKATGFGINVKLYRTPGVGALDFRTIFGKTAISLLVGAVDEFNRTFSAFL